MIPYLLVPSFPIWQVFIIFQLFDLKCIALMYEKKKIT